MTLTILKMIFVVLLCVPVTILAVRLLSRLIDEQLLQNRQKKEKKERERLAEEQQRRRRGL